MGENETSLVSQGTIGSSQAQEASKDHGKIIEYAGPIRPALSDEAQTERARNFVLEQIEHDLDDKDTALMVVAIPMHNNGEPRLHVFPDEENLERILRVIPTLPSELSSALSAAIAPKERSFLNLLLRLQSRKKTRDGARLRVIFPARTRQKSNVVLGNRTEERIARIQRSKESNEAKRSESRDS